MGRKVVLYVLVVFFMSLAITGKAEELMLATTTSTDNIGLLDYLAPQFAKDTGIRLKWVAVATGRALARIYEGRVLFVSRGMILERTKKNFFMVKY